MPVELFVLGLAACLQTLQMMLAGAMVVREQGDWAASPRDGKAPGFSPLTARLRRASANHFEALILFSIAVAVVVTTSPSSWLTGMAAWAYLGARILYVPAYAFGWTPWRSLIWGVGFLATFTILIAGMTSGIFVP